MPYKNLDQKRANDARYKEANRKRLAMVERLRIERLKKADADGFRAKARAAQDKFFANASAETKERYRMGGRARSQKRYHNLKNDPAFKAKNVARVSEWYQKNKDRAKANSTRARRERLKTDLQYKIGLALRRRLYMAIKKKHHGSSAVRDLGCSLEALAAHLERQFQMGMSWDNWGRAGWHIDHIKPLKSFDLTDPAQFAAA